VGEVIEVLVLLEVVLVPTEVVLGLTIEVATVVVLLIQARVESYLMKL
jgi:hypothetical protein